MTFPLLETERLKLVQVTDEHVAPLYDIMSREEVTKYYGMESLKDSKQAERIISSFQEIFEKKNGIRWGIVVKYSGTFVGTVGLNHLSMWSKKSEIGFELHPAYWRKGIAKEAIEEVLRYSFKELGLVRMGAVTFLDNRASIRLLEKIGFQKEGCLRGYLYQGNQNHDAFIFSLLQTEV